MPRRKQDRPKRMQWELKAEAERASACPKDQELPDALSPGDRRPDSTTVADPGSAASSCDDTFFPSKCDDQEPSFVSDMESACVEEPLQPVEPSISQPASPSDSVKSAEGGDAPLDFSLKNSFVETKRCVSPLQNSDQPLDLSLPQRRKSLDPCLRTVKAARLDTFQPTSPWGYCAPRSVPLSRSLPDGARSGQLNGDCGNSNLLSSLWLNKAVSQAEEPAKHVVTGRFTPSPSLGAVPMETTHGSPTPRFSAPPDSERRKHWSRASAKSNGSSSACDSNRQSPREAEEAASHVKKSRFKTCKAGAPPSFSSQLTPASYSSLKPSSPGCCNGVLKSAVSLPRKLVRGQDVWLGRGAEQTRQILKCMWCGQSFKSLADMTTHMRVTRHYANIISQEKIVSWRIPDDKVATQAHVNGTVPLKSYDHPFPAHKELGPHVVKKDKDTSGKVAPSGEGRRRPTRERRKKCLPVRKLLELERQEHARRPSGNDHKVAAVGDGHITCEECAEKVDAKDFVSHIKSCSRGSKCDQVAPRVTATGRPDDSSGPSRQPSSLVKTGNGSEAQSDEPSLSQNKKTSDGNSKRKGIPSVLNAIEKLIEKSFDKEKKMSASSGILQRLGIDEESCFSWQPNSPSRLSLMKAACDSSTTLRASPSVSSSYSHDSMDVRTDSERSLVVQAESCGDQVEMSSSSSNGRSSVSTPGTLNSFPGRSGHEPLTPDTCPSPNSASPPVEPGDTEPNLHDFQQDLEDNIKQPKESEEMEDARYQDPGGTSKGEGGTPVHCNCEEGPDWEQDSCSLPELSSPRNDGSFPPSEDSPRATRISPVTSRDVDRDTPVTSQKQEQLIVDPVNGNPLRELQKLLDKTEAHMSRTVLPAVPGSLLSFDWTSGSPGSVVACAFCETSFTSRSAYRHHLSKTHFVSDSDSSTWKGDEKAAADSSASAKSSPDCSTDDGPHSKFLKYTELAKQLSSKYV